MSRWRWHAAISSPRAYRTTPLTDRWRGLVRIVDGVPR